MLAVSPMLRLGGIAAVARPRGSPCWRDGENKPRLRIRFSPAPPRRTRMQLKVSPISQQDCSAAEWQARIDLAAAHRLAVMHGFHEGIFNHLTLAVPGKPERYYQIPFGLHWSEV